MNWKDAYDWMMADLEEKRILRRTGWEQETFVGYQKEKGTNVLVIAKTFDNTQYNTWKWMPDYEDILATDWETDLFTPIW